MSTVASSIRQLFTLASPIHWLWDQARQLYRKMIGDRLRNRIRPSAIQRDRFIVQYQRKGQMDDLLDALHEGRIDHQQWVLAMRAEVKRVTPAEV